MIRNRGKAADLVRTTFVATLLIRDGDMPS